MNAIIKKTVSPFQDRINVKTKVDNICKKLLTKTEYDTLMSISDTANVNSDACVLTVLHQNYGFTAEELKTFFDSVVAMCKAELEANNEIATYGEIPQVQALRDELGIDLVAWNDEVNYNG